MVWVWTRKRWTRVMLTRGVQHVFSRLPLILFLALAGIEAASLWWSRHSASSDPSSRQFSSNVARASVHLFEGALLARAVLFEAFVERGFGKILTDGDCYYHGMSQWLIEKKGGEQPSNMGVGWAASATWASPSLRWRSPGRGTGVIVVPQFKYPGSKSVL